MGVVVPADYLKMVTSAHINCPNYMEWLRVILTVLAETSEMPVMFPVVFSVRNAKGAQLDTIGKLMGVSRVLQHSSLEGGLSDDDFRLFIMARVLRSFWNGQLASLILLWQQLYPGIELKVKDNMDMSMDVECIGAISTAMQEMIQTGLILPIPMGVKVNYTVVAHEIPAKTVYLDTGLFHQGEIGLDKQEP